MSPRWRRCAPPPWFGASMLRGAGVLPLDGAAPAAVFDAVVAGRVGAAADRCSCWPPGRSAALGRISTPTVAGRPRPRCRGGPSGDRLRRRSHEGDGGAVPPRQLVKCHLAPGTPANDPGRPPAGEDRLPRSSTRVARQAADIGPAAVVVIDELLADNALFRLRRRRGGRSGWPTSTTRPGSRPRLARRPPRRGTVPPHHQGHPRRRHRNRRHGPAPAATPRAAADLHGTAKLSPAPTLIPIRRRRDRHPRPPTLADPAVADMSTGTSAPSTAAATVTALDLQPRRIMSARTAPPDPTDQATSDPAPLITTGSAIHRSVFFFFFFFFFFSLNLHLSLTTYTNHLPGHPRRALPRWTHTPRRAPAALTRARIVAILAGALNLSLLPSHTSPRDSHSALAGR